MVLPLMKIIVLPSGSHCKSVLAAPSEVSGIGSEPFTFISQISLLATKAILSTPPSTGKATGAGVFVTGSRVAVAVSTGGTMARDVSVTWTVASMVLVGAIDSCVWVGA